MAIIITFGMKNTNLACVVLIMMSMVMIMSNVPKAQAITCGEVVRYLSPCLSNLGQGGTPPPACCKGVAALNVAAKTTPDRRSACTCLKGLAGSLPPSSVAGASGIPGKCNVNVPYKIDPKTDCTKVV